jgi:hypothetical protein
MSARARDKVQPRSRFCIVEEHTGALGRTRNASSIARTKTVIHPHFNERCISDALLLSLSVGQALYRRPASDKVRTTIQNHGPD